ncbi:hypothetical protein D0A34_02290 [Microcoleus vaginatus PCC 9802]|nr:hypothetical protein D0A34_02290 [Microcoleus vaginatus PCC 9802]
MLENYFSFSMIYYLQFDHEDTHNFYLFNEKYEIFYALPEHCHLVVIKSPQCGCKRAIALLGKPDRSTLLQSFHLVKIANSKFSKLRCCTIFNKAFMGGFGGAPHKKFIFCGTGRKACS